MQNVTIHRLLTRLVACAAVSACSSPEEGSAAAPSGVPTFQEGPSDTPSALEPGGGAAVSNDGAATSNDGNVTSAPGNGEMTGAVPLSGADPNSPAAGAGNGQAGAAGTGQGGAPSDVAPAAGGAPTAQPDPSAPVVIPTGPIFTTGDWSGSVGIETVATGTTVEPTSFDALPAGEPFCVSGRVAASADYGGAARIVFNLNQAAGAAPLTTVPRGNGLAFTFTRSSGALLRVQLESPDGTSWCYSIPEVQGQAFVPYSAFNTECWTDTTGQSYASQPIESVVFATPGSNFAQTPHGFCVAGFADATNVSQAPPVPASFSNRNISGSLEEVAERAVVADANGRKYIVQNNAWGETSFNGSQVINYSNNGFTIVRQSAPSNGNVPVSFPSIFIGGNGYQGGDGSLATRIDDNLPRQISQISSIPTRFAHNATNGDYNATYDVWFASQPPVGEYQTATGAFLMVWTFKPQNRNAIGQVVDQQANVGGQTWQLVAGRRAEGGDANAADANSPVISYIKQGAALTDYEFDLNDFIQDAVRRSQSGQLNGLTFSPNLFLTDVFAGFEIWNGGNNLRIDAFEVEVQ